MCKRAMSNRSVDEGKRDLLPARRILLKWGVCGFPCQQSMAIRTAIYNIHECGT